MEKKDRFRHIKKIKHVRWLVPGWVFYEYYRTHKLAGHDHRKSMAYGVKAEAVRLAAMVSLPLPGTYELTTTGLALLRKKIESGEIKHFSFMAFKDFTPIRNLKPNLKDVTNDTMLKINSRKNIYFKLYYKKGRPYLKLLYKRG